MCHTFSKHMKEDIDMDKVATKNSNPKNIAYAVYFTANPFRLQTGEDITGQAQYFASEDAAKVYLETAQAAFQDKKFFGFTTPALESQGAGMYPIGCIFVRELPDEIMSEIRASKGGVKLGIHIPNRDKVDAGIIGYSLKNTESQDAVNIKYNRNGSMPGSLPNLMKSYNSCFLDVVIAHASPNTPWSSSCMKPQYSICYALKNLDDDIGKLMDTHVYMSSQIFASFEAAAAYAAAHRVQDQNADVIRPNAKVEGLFIKQHPEISQTPNKLLQIGPIIVPTEIADKVKSGEISNGGGVPIYIPATLPILLLSSGPTNKNSTKAVDIVEPRMITPSNRDRATYAKHIQATCSEFSQSIQDSVNKRYKELQSSINTSQRKTESEVDLYAKVLSDGGYHKLADKFIQTYTQGAGQQKKGDVDIEVLQETIESVYGKACDQAVEDGNFDFANLLERVLIDVDSVGHDSFYDILQIKEEAVEDTGGPYCPDEEDVINRILADAGFSYL
jgi:hypothetical protein